VTTSLWIVEHKTTSSDISAGSVFWSKTEMDAQCSLYVTAARQSGYDVRGVVYDVLRKPLLRPKIGESPSDYGSRVMASIAKDPDAYYRRAKVIKLDRELDETARDTWETVQAVDRSISEFSWPRHTDQCVRYNSLCQFFEVCAGRREVSTLTSRDQSGHFSKSSLETYRRCPREYLHAYHQGLVSGVKARALAVGTRVHAALESWMRRCDLDAAVAALIPCDDEFELNRLAALITGYDARWRGEKWKVLEVEKEFLAPVLSPYSDDVGPNITGRFDAIVEIAE
jgi:hypothetical protein